MSGCWGQTQRLKRALDEAEAVVIGAGSGLSTAAGFTYDGDRFQENFADFAAKYGIRDMYSGGFYPFPTPEEFWAYWSRYIQINRYQDAPKPVYQDLRKLVAEKDYFIITTNVDHCFQKAGFDKHRLFYTQGDYGLFQCSGPCCQETQDNESELQKPEDGEVKRMVPSGQIPYCPRCGKPMSINLRSDQTFVEDDGWHQAAERYEKFIQDHKKQKIVFLELGVGYNTPGIIKYPFWQMTMKNPKATYACLNAGEAYAPEEIGARSICVNGDVGEILDRMLE